jgi:hypothetical protein
MTNRQIAAELLPHRWRSVIPQELVTSVALREPRKAGSGSAAMAAAARDGARPGLGIIRGQ